MDILFLEPIHQDYKRFPWGGENIVKQFARITAGSTRMGESWEICARTDESNNIIRQF